MEPDYKTNKMGTLTLGSEKSSVEPKNSINAWTCRWPMDVIGSSCILGTYWPHTGQTLASHWLHNRFEFMATNLLDLIYQFFDDLKNCHLVIRARPILLALQYWHGYWQKLKFASTEWPKLRKNPFPIKSEMLWTNCPTVMSWSLIRNNKRFFGFFSFYYFVSKYWRID